MRRRAFAMNSRVGQPFACCQRRCGRKSANARSSARPEEARPEDVPSAGEDESDHEAEAEVEDADLVQRARRPATAPKASQSRSLPPESTRTRMQAIERPEEEVEGVHRVGSCRGRGPPGRGRWRARPGRRRRVRRRAPGRSGRRATRSRPSPAPPPRAGRGATPPRPGPRATRPSPRAAGDRRSPRPVAARRRCSTARPGRHRSREGRPGGRGGVPAAGPHSARRSVASDGPSLSLAPWCPPSRSYGGGRPVVPLSAGARRARRARRRARAASPRCPGSRARGGCGRAARRRCRRGSPRG